MKITDTRYIIERQEDAGNWKHIATCLAYRSGLRMLKQQRETNKSKHRLIKITQALLDV